MHRIIVAILFIVCNVLTVQAAQNKMVKHTETLTIDVSIKDPNVISIKNDKITDYLIRKKAIKGEISSKLGIFTLKPTASYYKKPFSVVLFTELGYRYTVIINPKDIPAQDIILNNNDIIVPKISQAGSILMDSYSLIKAMINNEDLIGFLRQDYQGNAEHLGNDIYKIDKKYHGEIISGEVLLFTNDTNNEIKLKEESFYTPGVIVVSLDDFNIKANQTAKVYRVIKNG